MFTRAIVKTPCRNIVNGISTASLGRPDYDLALKQHKDYIHALKKCGLTVIVLDPDESFPDSTFIEDACLITPQCAIITNPGAPSRRDETIQISETEQISQIISIIKDLLITNNNYTVEEHKKCVKNEMLERDFNNEVIKLWISYIE